MNRIVCFSLLTVSAALAQEKAQEAHQPKFELADVHVSKTAPGFVQSFGGQFHKGRYVNREVTMLQLIAAAYGVSDDVISGGPGWVSSDLFDIVARVPDGTNRATANLMLQSLLADRFGLVVRQGNNPVPRWVLTVAKGGSKLKPATGSEESGCKPAPGQPPPNPNDLASFPNIKVPCRNLTSAEIATNLRQMAGGYFDHDVVDETHLEGAWNFDLEWTARGILAAKGADGISAFAAIEKQLGLHAELKDVPLPSLLIEHVNRTPSPNPPDAAAALSEAPPRFEAAAIKPADPSKPPFQGLLYTGGSQMHSGGTLSTLIAMSLQIPTNVADDMVIGIPKSVSEQRWDILAKVPATGEGAPTIVNGRATPPPFSVALQMMYGLLVEQFQLKTHTENREVTVYALTVPNGKPKMAQATESERQGCKPDPNAPKPAANIQFMLSCKNYSMADVARDLQQRGGAYIDHPVVDATGLPGGWNFLIGWTPKQQLQNSTAAAATAAASGSEAAAADPGGITLFEAVEKQLGLKLVKQKRTIPVIVVDHVSEKPVE
jgi:uncharacterized protein (TIGR03435 family)